MASTRDDEDFQTLSSVKESLAHEPRTTCPQMLMLVDCEAPFEPSMVVPLDMAAVVEFGRGTTRGASGRSSCEVRLPDKFMSTRHARLTGSGLRFVLEDLGSKNGTIVNGTRRERHMLEDGDLVEMGHTMWLFRTSLPPCLPNEDSSLPGFATLSPSFARRLDKLRSLASSSVSVLVRGETGTGKELIARGVHQLSGVAGSFVAVNCGALPETLLEAELFGYRRGAFSGAVKDHPGLVRAAAGGTLFLDEIGDLPLPAQAALLRVLQEREVLPIGETKPIPVDFRLIAATHHDLVALVENERFRKDLYARISGFVVELPPVRQRREDLGLLLRVILRRHAGAAAASIRLGTDAVQALHRYSWPLNVRELEKCLEAAVVLAGDGPIRATHLPEVVQREPEAAAVTPAAAGAISTKPNTPSAPSMPAMLSPEDAQRKTELEALLKEHRGNITAVAAAMGKARVQIRRWMKRYGLSRGEE